MARSKKEEITEGSLTLEEQAIELATSIINKKYGKGSLITNSSDFPDIEWFSSGSLLLDRALGGGFARGRIIEILGPESSGKTTLALHLIASAQEQGYRCAFIDVEHALDMKYAEALSVVGLNKPGGLIVSQPETAEEALDIIDILVNTKAVKVIVLDSVAALLPKAELEGDVGASHMGLQARLMGQTLRKITGHAKQNDVMIVFINQIRMKIGITWGSNETTPGGNALKFYASQRLDIRRIETIKEGEAGIPSAIKARVKVIKNKVASPFRQAELTFQFGKGVDRLNELLDLAIEKNIIVKGGAWNTVSWSNERVQGRSNLYSHFEEDEKEYKRLENLVLERELNHDITTESNISVRSGDNGSSTNETRDNPNGSDTPES